jgi:hypothetical protein
MRLLLQAWLMLHGVFSHLVFSMTKGGICGVNIGQCSNGGFGHMFFSLVKGGICRAVTTCCSGFTLYLLMLTVSGKKVRF